MLTLDHVFVCVDPELAEAKRLMAMGLTCEFERQHPGQGTCNKLVLFADHYLELLYLADRREAEHNLVRLDRRVDWRHTGASPFGIALRGPKAAVADHDWTSYAIAGAPKILILRRTLDDLTLPLVILFEHPANAPGGPAHGRYEAQLLDHACGATGIASVTIAGPGLGDGPALPLPANVSLRDGASPQMTVRLVGDAPPTGRVGELLHLA